MIDSASNTATTVTGMRTLTGGSRIATSGSSAPMVNDNAEDAAANHGFVSSSGSMQEKSN